MKKSAGWFRSGNLDRKFRPAEHHFAAFLLHFGQYLPCSAKSAAKSAEPDAPHLSEACLDVRLIARGNKILSGNNCTGGDCIHMTSQNSQLNKIQKKYVITRMNGCIFSFLLHDQKAVEIHCDEEYADSGLGNIYIGKIKNIAKNIDAAFVEISPNVICYLQLSDMKDPVYTKKGKAPGPQAGDELLVQISREAQKSKAPALTTNLTLHGKYVLLTTGKKQIGVSSKLPRAERERLLALTSPYFSEEDKLKDTFCTAVSTPSIYDEGKNFQNRVCIPKAETLKAGTPEPASGTGMAENPASRPYGWLLRTNAGGMEEEVLLQDIRRLQNRFQLLMDHAKYRTCFSCLYAMPPSYLSRLLNLYKSEAEQIITDDKVLYEDIHAYLLENQPEDIGKLIFYKDHLLPISKLYSLEHQLSQALSEKVWLNSGGYLVIQPTEALTVIDVNTGKYEGGKKREATFLKINKEAALESARQIRLRNLSGIILIDFINMEAKESTDELLSVLDAELRRDPIRTVLVDMTKLSLVEITRQKKERTLAEAVQAGKRAAAN